MRAVVTGIGPRSGTSAMMRLLISSGMEPHRMAEAFPSYVAPEKNPEGFWDIRFEDALSDEVIQLEDNEVIKLWSPFYRRVDWETVDRLIVMHRADRVAQIESMLSTAEAEGAEASPHKIEQLFWEPTVLIKDLPISPIYIETEDLRSDPEGALTKIKEAI